MLFQTLLEKRPDTGVKNGDSQLVTVNGYGNSDSKTTPYTVSAAMAYRYALNDLDKYKLFVAIACENVYMEASNCTQIGEHLLIESPQGQIYYSLYEYTTAGNDIVFSRANPGVDSYYSILFLTFENVDSLLMAGSWNESVETTEKTVTYENKVHKSNDHPLLGLFNFLLVDLNYVCNCLATGEKMAFDNRALYDNYYGNAGRLQPFVAYGPEGDITLTRTDTSAGVEKYAQCVWYEVVPQG